MPSDLSPTQRLAGLVLGQPLADYVSERRAAKPRWSWRMIAEALAEDTRGEIAVSAETLRLWYSEVAA